MLVVMKKNAFLYSVTEVRRLVAIKASYLFNDLLFLKDNTSKL